MSGPNQPPKKKGSRTGRNKTIETPSQAMGLPTAPPPPLADAPSRQSGGIVRTSRGRGNRSAPAAAAIPLAPKAGKKTTRRKKATKATTIDETEGDDHECGKSELIQIPEALLQKSAMKSVMAKEGAGAPAKSPVAPRADQLFSVNQAFVDGLDRKTWPTIAAEFAVNHQESPTINPATRVALEDGFEYDASRVEIVGVEPKFIVASAPTAEVASRESFWRMVFDSNVTNVFYMESREGDPADAFLPWTANDGKDYGKMFVANKKATVSKRDAQAVLEVLPEGCSNSIIIRFVQCIAGWPDRVVMESEPRKAVLHLVRMLKDEKGTILVVCRTGLAKSCMLVMVHSVITLLNGKALKEIADVLAKLRADRWGAISAEQQYLLIHQAVIDYIQVKTPGVKGCGDVKKKLFKYSKIEKAEKPE